MENIYETTNRKLENFLYVHKIRFIAQKKSDDGLNCWMYINNDEFKQVLDEYKRIYVNTTECA